MREQRKAERIRILGAPVDPIRVDRAMNLTSHYLEKNKFEYIVFVNTAAAIYSQESEEFAEFLNQSVLALPGDKNVENAIEENLRIGEDHLYQSEYFGRLFHKLNRMGSSVCVLHDQEEAIAVLEEKFTKQFDRLHVEIFLWQEEENQDRLVNEINILAPSLLLICGDYHRIYSFMKDYGSKINAGLCLCMEEMAEGSAGKVPAWVERFHLQSLYYWLYEKPKLAWKDNLFQKKLKETNEQMAENQLDKPKEANDQREDWNE